MSATAATGGFVPEDRGRVGMACLIFAESAFFSIFLVAYLFYIGKSATGPQPAQVLDLPVLATVCLLSSSGSIAVALKSLGSGHIARFLVAWGLTIALGVAFLGFTAQEWQRLITIDGLTLRTNLFGTTFYSLVGFHAAHVLLGVLMMTSVALLALTGRVNSEHAPRVELVGWYWHFVDAVWLAVLTVVYVLGR